MWKYLSKRLLLAVPTLLVITLITFLLIRLAPGDPSQMDFTEQLPGESVDIDLEMLEQNRRTFGLDKPVLINLDVKDRRRGVLSQWEEIVRLYEELEAPLSIDPENKDRVLKSQKALKAQIRKNEERLLKFEKRMIPYLVPMAVAYGVECFELLSRLLRNGAKIEEAEDSLRLAAWWSENSDRFTDARVNEALTLLETCTDEKASEQARHIKRFYGGLAVAQAVERIEALEDSGTSIDSETSDDSGTPNYSVARKRLIALVAPISGYSWKLMPGSKDSRYATALTFIRKWWASDHLLYREINAFERFYRTFIEAQYPIWLGRILRLDFGDSYIDHRPVTQKVWEAFKVTLSFQIIVLFLAYLISVPLGVFSAVKQGTIVDRSITVGLFMLYSLPNFWVAYLLILLLGGGQFLDIFPIQGLGSEGAETLPFWPWLWDRLWHMCLPVVCMTYVMLAGISRYTRSGMLETIRQDYVRTARAKGLSEPAVIFRHVLRNGMMPLITVLGGSIPALISGSVIVEYIFGIHGMGNLGITAVLQRDYPTIMAITSFSALLVLVGVLVSDLLYAVLDPRIRFERSRSS